LLLALGVLGCGPSVDVDDGGGSADAATGSGTTETGGVTTGGTSADTVADASTGTSTNASGGETTDATGTAGSLDCPENDALPPFCYRRYPIDWDGHPGTWAGRTRVGRFGPRGELAYLLSGGEPGEEMGLASWNGAGFDVRAWGIVPNNSRASRAAIRMFSEQHSDLLFLAHTESAETVLRIARWGEDGPLDEVDVAVAPDIVFGGTSFEAMPIRDLDGDGLEEFAGRTMNDVGGDLAHAIVRNVDGVPTYTTAFGPTMICGALAIGFDAGDFDADGVGDFAAIGDCEVDEKDGVFTYAALWGEAAGQYEQTTVEFPADGRAGWLGAGDFDGDGVDDVALTLGHGDATGESLAVEVHRSRGDRSFDPPVRVWSQDDPPTADGVGIPSDRTFATGDVDGDGADDFVFVGSLHVVIAALGRADSRPLLEPWAYPGDRAIPAADLNGDGRLDFILYRESGLIEGLVSSG
jgi:hypothetical protein